MRRVTFLPVAILWRSPALVAFLVRRPGVALGMWLLARLHVRVRPCVASRQLAFRLGAMRCASLTVCRGFVMSRVLVWIRVARVAAQLEDVSRRALGDSL